MCSVVSIMEGGAYRSSYSDMQGLDFQTKHECWPVLQHDHGLTGPTCSKNAGQEWLMPWLGTCQRHSSPSLLNARASAVWHGHWSKWCLLLWCCWSIT